MNRQISGKADLHIHSNHSDGSHPIEDILNHIEKDTDLDVVAITDHDTIQGALEAQRIAIAKHLRFEVIVGEEITAREGHVLGLFLKEAIQSGLSVADTISRIKEQGGLAVAVHPFYRSKARTSKLNGKGNKFRTPKGVGASHLMSQDFDAVETINATPTFETSNQDTQHLNNTYLFKPEIGASDAHIVEAVGKGYTVFSGKTGIELKEAISNRTTQAVRERWYPKELLKYSHFFMTNFAVDYIKTRAADFGRLPADELNESEAKSLGARAYAGTRFLRKLRRWP